MMHDSSAIRNAGAATPLQADLEPDFWDFKAISAALFSANTSEETVQDLLRRCYMAGNVWLLQNVAINSASETTQALAFELLDAIADLAEQDPWEHEGKRSYHA